MISTRPYLIRAFYEWIVDSDCTPHIVVNAELPNVEVPRDFVEAGQIVLNIAMQAVQNLNLNNDAVSFQARFSGVPHDVFVPVAAVMAIYARENGRGMVFSEDDDLDPEEQSTTQESGGKTKSKGKAHLTVVK
jgi:stringent starvation protein B